MARVDTYFRSDGRLAELFDSYEYRPGQHQMAQQVEATLESGGQLMVEAGTGIGKTLAYLIPTIQSGRKVVISTGTRNLQDQIAERDLPLLSQRLGLEFRAVVMKGRENYLCRYRLGQLEREPLLEDPSEFDWIETISEWSQSTRTGDRAELEDLPDRLRLWRDINARADTCTGSKCPEYEDCWLVKLKRKAQRADVIVVNHHLFFADLALRSAFGSVLPEYDCAIFDEAHLLEETATLYFGSQVSSNQLEQLAKEAERLAAQEGGPVKGGGGASGLRDAAFEFFEPIERRVRRDASRLRFAPVDEGGLDLEAEWAHLSEALDEVSRQTERFAEQGERVESVPDKAEALRDAMTVVLQRDDNGFVYGLERRGRNIVLSAAPIDVSRILREKLFEPLHAAVLTSATLTIEKQFDFFKSRLGLDEAMTLEVPSPFDYPNQAVLYLPKRMPEPRDPNFTDRATEEILNLLSITDGRAFLLFTSYAQLYAVQERLEEIERWPLFVQGEGSKAAMLRKFRSTPRAVLLGTSAFWQGVDVPGDALSLVVVDKLPFAVPSDPLIAARIDRIRQLGGHPFMDYQVPMAVLDLKQGVGRLIRSTTDRGIVAVLDPRLTTKRYGKTFVRSLPPLTIQRDPNPCAVFFKESITTAERSSVKADASASAE